MSLRAAPASIEFRARTIGGSHLARNGHRQHAVSRIVPARFAQAPASSRLAGCRRRKLAGECRRDHRVDRCQFAGAARQSLARRTDSRLRSRCDHARARSDPRHGVGAGQYQVQDRRTPVGRGTSASASCSSSPPVAELSLLRSLITPRGFASQTPQHALSLAASPAPLPPFFDPPLPRLFSLVPFPLSLCIVLP